MRRKGGEGRNKIRKEDPVEAVMRGRAGEQEEEEFKEGGKYRNSVSG